MAGVSKSLQDYMRGNSSNESPSESSGGFNIGRFNPFKKTPDEKPLSNEDVANSWFSQAQRDPLFPSLVCILYILYR